MPSSALKALNKRRRRGKIKSEGVKPSAILIVEYTRDLQKLVDFIFAQWTVELKQRSVLKITDSEQQEVNTIYRNMKTYLTSLAAMQEKIALKYVKVGNKFNRRGFIGSIQKAIGIDVTDILKEKGVAAELNDALIRNTKYIKSVGNELNAELQTQIQTALRKGLKSDDALFSLQKELQKIKTMGYNRAKLIATDQMGKLNSKLNEIRQTNLGITKYTWLDSDDKRVRPLHVKYDGKEFKWSDPPKDGHPGQAIRCRCEALPIFKGVV